MSTPPVVPEDVGHDLLREGYLADEGLATAIFLALRLGRPLFLEGEPGVGKTEVAKVLARVTGGELLRLQCYEGIDAAQALYEWDYARQMLHLRVAEATGALAGGATDDVESQLYSERFLIRRPLLRALEASADGVPPVVVITSNRTRDVHDALKRRCLYHWVDHPTFEREVAIVRLRVPEVDDVLARQAAAAVAELRERGLYKPPGVAETIDWVQALQAIGRSALDDASVDATLGTVVKHREDLERVRSAGVADLVKAAVARAR